MLSDRQTIAALYVETGGASRKGMLSDRTSALMAVAVVATNSAAALAEQLYEARWGSDCLEVARELAAELRGQSAFECGCWDAVLVSWCRDLAERAAPDAAASVNVIAAEAMERLTMEDR